MNVTPCGCTSLSRSGSSGGIILRTRDIRLSSELSEQT